MILFPIITSIISIIFALRLRSQVMKHPRGDSKMVEISDAIKEGSKAYLKRQNQTVLFVAIVLFLIIGFTKYLGWLTAFGFLIGAFSSALAGFLGMMTAVDSNSRTAEAAKSGLSQAFDLAYKGGAVTGFLVVGIGLLSVSLFYWFAHDLAPLIGLAFVGSLISVFARLGGGIFTKGADVGADLVGKIEAGIPEDDPRNPAVIADNVGDNVGDDAGMAADIFETYAITAIAAMILGQLLMPTFEGALTFPLVILAVAAVASILGSLFVKLRGKAIMGALYWGLAATIAFCALSFYPVVSSLMAGNATFIPLNLYFALLTGVLVTAGMVFITEYYTGTKYGPVQHLAGSSQTGHATNIIAGLATSMKSTFAPVILISAAVLLSFSLAGLYGIALAAVGMLSLAGIIVAIDAFGPITDNAGGIAEMANLPESVRKVTDPLDAVGN